MNRKLSEAQDAATWREALESETLRQLRPVRDEDERVSLGNGGALRLRDHAALVYWDSAELLEMAVPYLVEGLKAGDKVVYVAHDHPVDKIEQALSAAGVAVESQKARGALSVVSAKDAFFPAGKFDPDEALKAVEGLAEQARAEGFGRVRLSVEMTYLLSDVEGMERGAEFESRANEEVFARFPFACVCTFNGNLNAGGVIEDVLRTHPVLLSRGIPLVNPWYQPWHKLREDRLARARWQVRRTG